MPKIRKTKIPKRTIAKSLHEKWLLNKRKKDVENICILAKENQLPASKPTISKALMYGHVLETELVNLINKYFEDRNLLEKEQAKQLNNI